MLRPWNLKMDIGKAGNKPVYVQIAESIAGAIKSGKLKNGDALPGSRRLAEQLKVNRNTVVEALEVLIADGWLTSVERKGTFVSEKIPSSDYAAREERIIKLPVVFDDGVPDTRLSPVTELSRVYRQLLNRNAKRQQIPEDRSDLGDDEFREAIARMLNYNRGMNIAPSQICITRGSQMAVYLSAQCLLQSGDVVLVENPGYKAAWKAFAHSGAVLLPVSVDKEGINVEELERLLHRTPRIKAVYVTPYHQFPTTVVLSAYRRVRLIELSNVFGFTIIEDDCYNEFHFEDEPVFPVSSYENVHNYVYIGTFSKMVSPDLNIGFLVSNTIFIRKAGELRKVIEVRGDSIMEKAVLELIRSGDIRKYLKKAVSIYRTKRDLFANLLLHHVKGKAEFTKPAGGLAFWIRPLNGIDLYKLNERLAGKGIMINTPDKYSFDKDIYGIRMGFASLSEKQLEEGVVSLSRAM